MLDDQMMAANLFTGLTLQQTMWCAMHQDYSSHYVWDDVVAGKVPSDEKAGEIVEKALLKGGKGHFGPLEHGGITISCGYMPHSVMQQLRTHRIGISFDTQSFRFTSQGLIDAYEDFAEATSDRDKQSALERVFYFRPVGDYQDRELNKYHYSESDRHDDLTVAADLLGRYHHRVKHRGFAPEHCRGMLPFELRQHFVVSFSLRAFLHFMDLRAKLDAQQEIRELCDLLWPHLQQWAPEFAGWYEKSRLHKAKLAP